MNHFFKKERDKPPFGEDVQVSLLGGSLFRCGVTRSDRLRDELKAPRSSQHPVFHYGR